MIDIIETFQLDYFLDNVIEWNENYRMCFNLVTENNWMNWILMKYPNRVHRELDSKIQRLYFHLFIVMHIVTIIIFNNLLLIHTKYILSIDNTQILKHWDHHVWKKTKAGRRRWEESSVKLLAPKCIYQCALIKKR